MHLIRLFRREAFNQHVAQLQRAARTGTPPRVLPPPFWRSPVPTSRWHQQSPTQPIKTPTVDPQSTPVNPKSPKL